jgi:hypothetical protein
MQSLRIATRIPVECSSMNSMISTIEKYFDKLRNMYCSHGRICNIDIETIGPCKVMPSMSSKIVATVVVHVNIESIPDIGSCFDAKVVRELIHGTVMCTIIIPESGTMYYSIVSCLTNPKVGTTIRICIKDVIFIPRGHSERMCLLGLNMPHFIACIDNTCIKILGHTI